MSRENGIDLILQRNNLVHGLDRSSHLTGTCGKGVGETGLLGEEGVVLGCVSDHD